MTRFYAVKGRQLYGTLARKPLNYQQVRQRGSHRSLRSEKYPPLTLSFDDGDTIPAGLVRKILVKEVGLDDDEALGLLKG